VNGEWLPMVDSRLDQGCQMMVYFQTKNPNLGKFLKVEDVGIFYGHLVFL
jgi:hypothetical protein